MKKNLKWVGLAVVLLAVGIGAYFKFSTPALEYRTAEIERDDLEVNILSTGTVQPENRLEIKPPVAGRIEQILVNEGDLVKKGQILGWLSSAERAALLDAARSKGNDEVKRWQEMYKATPIIAPIAGTIILRKVEAGQTFTTNDAVLVMSDHLTVKAQVDETDLAQIKLKQSAELRLDAYPDQMITAFVDQIAFEAKTVNNVTTYIVSVLPTEAPSFMRSGMTANVTFKVESKEDVLLVPNEFLKYENGKASVLIRRNPKDNPVDQEIEIGKSDGKMSEVLSGLNEGDQVLLLKKNKDKSKASSPFSPMGGKPKGR